MLAIEAYGGLGGMAKFNRDLAEALAARPDCAQIVVLPRLMRLGPATAPVPDKAVQDNRAIGGRLRYLLYCLGRLFFGGRFDLIVCGHVTLVPFALMWGLLRRTPVLLTIHGIDAWQPSRWRLINLLVAKVPYVVSVSALTRDRFIAWSGIDKEKVFILPNCVDAMLYGPGPKPAALVEQYQLAGKRVIMTLGRAESNERNKGFDEVIEVLPDILRDAPDVVYLIAGPGNDLERLGAKAQSLGVGDHVVFTGLVTEAEKVDHFRLADAFVMPSRGKGFGIVLLEALACGIPVVASRADGGREALAGGEMGRLVDPDDREDIKDAILAALAAPGGVVPEGLERFSPAAFTRQVDHIIDSITVRQP